MPLNKNGDINQDFIDTLKLQSNVDSPVISIQQNGIPVFSINPMYTKLWAVITRSTSGDALFPTQSQWAGRKFALTWLNFVLVKDAACDVATGITSLYLRSGQTGAYIPFVRIPITTLTASTYEFKQTFEKPIITEVNSVGDIGYIQGTFTAGTYTRSVTVGGYLI